MEIRESWFEEGDLEDVMRVTATVDPRIRAAGKEHRKNLSLCFILADAIENPQRIPLSKESY